MTQIARIEGIKSTEAAKWLKIPSWQVVGLVGLAWLLRLWQLGTRSLWVDELKLFERMADLHPSMFIEPYFNPPLIYFIVHLWMSFSNDELFLRLLPATVGALTTWPVYALGQRLLGSSVARLGALLFALSPFHIYYSQEINTYAFATLFAVLATLFFVRLVQGEQASWLWFGYGLTLTLGLFTHTYLIFLPVVHVLSLLLIWREALSRWRAWLAVYAIVGLLYLPRLLPLLTAVAPGGDASAWTELISPRLLTIQTALPAVAAMFYSYVLGMTVEPRLMVLPLIGMAALVAAGTLLLTWQVSPRRSILFLWLMFTLPLLLALIISMTVTPIYSSETPRYTLFFLPAFLLLLAQGLLLLRPTWRWAGLMILMLATSYSLYNYYYRWDAVGMGDFRTIAAHINATAQPGDLLIHTSNPSPTPLRKVATASRRPINYYLGDGWESVVVLDEDGWAELQPSLANQERLWIVFFNDTSMLQTLQAELEQFTPSLELPAWTAELSKEGFEQVDVQEYPGRKHVAVYLFERKSP